MSEIVKLCFWRHVPILWFAKRRECEMPRKLLTAYGPDIIDRLEYGLKMDLALPQVEHYHLEEVLALLRDLREQGFEDGHFVLFEGITQECGQIKSVVLSRTEIEYTTVNLRKAFEHLVGKDGIGGLVYIQEDRAYQFLVMDGGIIPLGNMGFTEWASVTKEGFAYAMENVEHLALCFPDSLEDDVVEACENSKMEISMTGNATDLHDFLLEYGLQYSPRLVWELTLTDEFTELIRQPEATILGVISTLNWLSEGMIDKFFISAYIPCYDIYLIGLKSDEKQTPTRIMVTEQSESEPYLGLDNSEEVVRSMELIAYVQYLCEQQPDVEVCIVSAPTEFGEYFLQAHGGFGGIVKNWITREEIVSSNDLDTSSTEWDADATAIDEEFMASLTISDI